MSASYPPCRSWFVERELRPSARGYRWFEPQDKTGGAVAGGWSRVRRRPTGRSGSAGRRTVSANEGIGRDHSGRGGRLERRAGVAGAEAVALGGLAAARGRGVRVVVVPAVGC